MSQFIKKVVKSVLENYTNLKNLVLILPSPKTIQLAKKEFELQCISLPKFYTMRGWMKQVSGLSLMEGLELYLSFFEIVREKELFLNQKLEEFMNWGPSILLDFDEIDLYLLDSKNFFSYMSSSERISAWDSSFDQTSFQETSLEKKEIWFWQVISFCYQELKEKLLSQNRGYHGMIFKEAFDKLDEFIKNNSEIEKIIFIGMNALTNSESELIKKLLLLEKADTYWDVDAYYLEDPLQEAGSFIRKYSQDWPFLSKNSIKWIENHFLKEKKIEVMSVSSKMAQVKLASVLLERKLKKNPQEKIALIHLDESLAFPLLYSLPKCARNSNLSIKIGFEFIGFSEVFSTFMKLFVNRKKLGLDQFYYKDLVELFRNSFFREILGFREDFFLDLILKKNLYFISDEILQKHLFSQKLLKLLGSKNNKLKYFLETLNNLANDFKTIFLKKEKQYQKELKFLVAFKNFLDLLRSFSSDFYFISTNKAFFEIYLHWIKSNTISLNYQEDSSNLYVMNFLESRLLDFEKVIFLSVNEGVLPPEKKNSSHIAFEIRKFFSLPTFKEKEALYAYHFYQILAKAKSISLIYNSSLDKKGSGGKSRFIHQLELESPHLIKERFFSSLFEIQNPTPTKIIKTSSLLDRLEILVEKGLSPSTLSLYIRNPLSFYYKKILYLLPEKKLLENAEGQLIGSILHQVLEKLYKPFLNKSLEKENILEMKNKANELIEKVFAQENQSSSSGKNFLIFRVIHKYIEEILAWDENSINKGDELIIYFLEEQLAAFLHSSFLSKPVLLLGRIDRIERRNGKIFIIDYKTALVEPYELAINSREDFDEVLRNPKYDKILQLLIYGYLWFENRNKEDSISLGILSFSRLKNGFMPLTITKNSSITYEDIKDFLPFLASKIFEILDPELPLIENLEDGYAQD